MSGSSNSLVKPNFINLFLGADPNVSRSSKGMRLVRPKKSKEPEIITTVTTTPTPETAPAPAPAPAPAAEVPAPPAPASAPSAETPAPPTTNETATAAAITTTGWTNAEDAILVGMKTQGKSWKEIHDLLPTKSKSDVKQRSKELDLDSKGNGKGKGKEGATSFAEGAGQGNKKAKKGILKQAGNVSDVTDDEGIDPRGLPMSDSKSFKKTKKTAALKIIEVDSDEEQVTDLRGHPLVFMDLEAGLTEAHMKILYKLTRKNDDVKWLEIASRFYDKTGKRMEPDALKHMLKNL